MRPAASLAAAVALLLALGALAALALPPTASIAPVAAVSGWQGASPQAFAQRLNMVALPLDAHDLFQTLGLPFDSKGLAEYVGPAVVKVQRWEPDSQTYQSVTPPFLLDNFPLEVGGVYMITLVNSDPSLSIFSITGSVPPPSQTTPKGTAGRVEYRLRGGTPCELNHITIPLDRPDLSDSALLARAVGGVEKIQTWDAGNQVYLSTTAPFLVDNFATRIGYPYVICVSSGADGQIWP